MTSNYAFHVAELLEDLAMYDRTILNEDDDNVRNFRRETEALRKALRDFNDARKTIWR